MENGDERQGARLPRPCIALRLVALRKGGRIEENLATESGSEMFIHAPANVHSAHASLCCWSSAFSPLPAWLTYIGLGIGTIGVKHREDTPTEGALGPLCRCWALGGFEG